MSDCCFHPVVGKDMSKLRDKIDYKSYKPGDLRLYGRPAESYKKDVADEKIKKLLDELYGNVETLGGSKDIIDQINKLVEQILNHLKKSAGVVDDGITVAVFDGDYFHFLPISLNVEDGVIESIGVIYGYAYEGHCYKLPKPQIMCLSDAPSLVKDGDCGYDPTFGYAVWSIDKLERAIVLDVRADELKTLVLDENMPGSRSPLAYAQSMNLAPQRHRD
ncbi:hypothetical protein PZN02_002612 [Sinorhizobium garamanticum]|uniref:Uncharacterized protein n=1 Tax=Sinorhizobium garamanticum TaxID=680247 RepID=A0ABY8DF26_9HYPH|nr:hypothetical protein [Sinorhizobium garamanticum]WEX89509.1 hypothetical protein PZN02_002612 [Sinorhizobium garamanticum]